MMLAVGKLRWLLVDVSDESESCGLYSTFLTVPECGVEELAARRFNCDL
jgi:hypothetical protein